MEQQIFIKMYAGQICEDAINLDGPATFEWLQDKIVEYAGPDPRLTEEHYSLIRDLVNQKIRVVKAEPASMISTKEHRKNLVSQDRLDANGYYWPRFRQLLEQKLGPSVAKSLNDDVNRVCLQMPDPLQDSSFLCKGLVIGDVQAGKTNNYTALINKTADLGYKLIVVLTGVTEPLRSQTQRRLDHDFVGQESVADRNSPSTKDVGVGKLPTSQSELTPHSLTDAKLDFESRNRVPMAAQNSPVLVVTKKHKTRLESILRWMQSQCGEVSGKFDYPTLVIDDEADNASVDTSDYDEDPKTINKLIRSIVSTCSKVTYVGYTATPFANVFIDPDADADGMVDLFPSHFIVCLNSPSTYCGGHFFYSTDNDTFAESAYVRRYIYDCESFIPLTHKADLKPTAIPPSMKEALASFFVAAAIKDIRRQKGLLSERFDSCLINVSRLTHVQTDLGVPVSEYVEELWTDARTGLTDGPHFQRMKKVFIQHYKSVVGVKETWDEVRRALSEMERPAVKIIHYHNKDQLDYADPQAPTKVVAIGGFKLSRGLTLDGLTVSYFYRRSMMYDTLMQMARWFGYREGYRDLLRLYTTPDATKWYEHITSATEELKRDLLELEATGQEPKDFGIKVRSHEDALIVTAKNKMRSATEIVGKISFENKLKETAFVDRRPEINDKNLENVAKFFSRHMSDVRPYDVIKTNGKPRFYLLEDTLARDAINLLEILDLNWGNDWARTEYLLRYLRQHSEGFFSKWDVAFQTTVQGGARQIRVSDLEIGVQRRAPHTLAEPRTVGAVMQERVKYSVALSDNRKVATSSIDYVGIPEAFLSDELREKGAKARAWKKANRPNPLLLFHLIQLDLHDAIDKLRRAESQENLESSEGQSAAFYREKLEAFVKRENLAENYLALSISIPGNPNVEDGVTYQISKREYESRFGRFEYDQ